MDRPDFTRRQVVDRFFYEFGFNVHYLHEGDGPHPEVPTSGTGFCGLEWRPLADGRLLVIAERSGMRIARFPVNTATLRQVRLQEGWLSKFCSRAEGDIL